jgi:phosphomethylpyrimidine synthase
MREVRQAPTQRSQGVEENPPIVLYDHVGPLQTDPAVAIDLERGLAPLRAAWIRARADIEEIAEPSSAFCAPARARPAHGTLRFERQRPVGARAGRPARDTDALRAARRDHARDGVRRDPREPARGGARGLAAPGRVVRRGDPARITPEFVRDEVARGRASCRPT